jgi:hypothetical protein
MMEIELLNLPGALDAAIELTSLEAVNATLAERERAELAKT